MSKKTRYDSTSPKAIEIARAMMGLNQKFDKAQQDLAEQFRQKSQDLVDAMQQDQLNYFQEMATELGMGEFTREDALDWALQVVDIDDGAIAMVRRSDDSLSAENDDCDCMACQMRRMMFGQQAAFEDEPQVDADGDIIPPRDRLN